MNRTEEGLFIGAALIVLTLAVLYGVQTLFIRAANAEAAPPSVAVAPPRIGTPAPVTPALPSTPAPTRPETAPATVSRAPTTPRAETTVPEATTAPVSSPPATETTAAALTPTAPKPTTPEATGTTTPPPSPPPTPTTQAQPQPSSATPLDRGRELTRLLYAERLGDLWAAFSPTVRAEWGSLDAFRAYRVGGRQAYGAETRVLDEDVVRDGNVTYYTRTATFERGERSRWTVIFGLDDRGGVQEFGVVGADLLPGGSE